VKRSFTLSAVRTVVALPVVVACGLLLLTGCPSSPPPAKPPAHDDHDHDHDHGHHAHPEHGPHNGALVMLGGHSAHVEVVLDKATGTVTAYLLDAHAEKPLTTTQGTLEMGFRVEKTDAAPDDLPELHALTLTGKPGADGQFSEFTGQADELKGVDAFDASFVVVTVGKDKFEEVKFSYPEGNEHHH